MSCRKMRGLLAASVYGDLTDDERRTLEGHLASCPACRNEAAGLARVSAAIPIRTPKLDRDLMPALRRSIREEKPQGIRISFPWRFAAPLAAVASIVLISYVGLLGFGGRGVRSMPVAALQPRVDASPVEDSPVQCALTEADRLAGFHDYTGAYRTLKQAVDEHPDSPLAADAQLRRADIAFNALKWYPEAYDDYELLADRYPSHFANSAECIRRRDLLAEARDRDFASLHALDAAQRSSDSQFAQLETLIGRYPGTFVASAAANEMARLASGDNSAVDGSGRLAAMERARDHCTSVVAKRQLDLEVGRIYQRDINDPDKARACFNQIISNDNTALAQLARQSLSELGSAH